MNRLNLLVILFLLFGCFISTTAQNISYIDSLEQSFGTAPEEQKTSILTKMALYYLDLEPQRSIEYGNKAASIAKKEDDNKLTANILSIIGVAYEYLGGYRKAIELHKEALKYAELTEAPKEIGSSYINLANAYQYIGKQDVSLQFNLKALEKYQNIDFDHGIAKALNNIGNVYLYSSDYEKALGYYLQAIEYKQNIGDDYSLATGYHNLALAYQALVDYDNALIYYDKALEKMDQVGDIYSQAVCYSNIANLQYNRGLYAVASDYSYRSLEIYEQLGNKDGIATILSRLAEIQIAQKDYDDVVDLILRSLETAKELNNKTLISENYQILSDYYEKTGKIENALLFFKKHKSLNDSISIEDTNKRIAELNIQYETEQRNKEIELLKKDAENQAKIRNYLIYAVVLGIMVLMFLLNLYFEKLKDAKIRQEISEKLQESEIRFRSLTENLTSCIFTFDVSGYFTYVNPATTEITEYSEEELLKMKFYDVVHPVHKDLVSQRGLKRIQGEDVESNYQFKIITKDGKIKWLETTAARIVVNNQMLVLGAAYDVTERKEASEKLKESEAKFRALFAAMNDVIMVLDRAGKYLDIAPTNDTLLYKPAQELLGNYIPNVFDEEMSEYFLEKINECLDTGESISVDYSLLIDDREYWFEGRISPMTESSVIMVVRDITKRIKDNKKLSESENRYRNLVESLEEGMVITDNNLNFVFANKAAADMYGYSRKELLKMNVRDIVPVDEFGVIKDQIKIRLQGNSSIYENWNIRKDGERRLIKVSASPLIKEGEVIGTTALFSDITEIRAAEEKIKHSLKEKEILLQEIYHRVKNNMQVISSMLKLQSQHINKENALDVFRNIQNRVKSMSLVHEKLYRSQDLARVDFQDYLETMMKQLLTSYRDKAQKISYEIASNEINLNISTTIACGLIINEIVTNSLKHAFPGNKAGKISISIDQISDGKYKLIIGNNGVDFAVDPDLDNPTTFGLQLVDLMTQQLKAERSVDRSNGVRFSFIFNEIKR